MLRNTLNAAMKESMKSGDKERLSAIRLILANVKQKDIDVRVTGNMEGISDTQILQVLQTMIKQRRDSIDLFDKGNRPDLIEKEQVEIAVIESFLPQQMTDAEIETAIRQAIQEMAAKTPQDMGRVMACLKDLYAGKMDFGKASLLVKQKLM
ncbi:MAG: hypothetical protein UX60_C0023G0003 [Berkelbacteria bacterium GW2011_GWA2_46_7]|uniref:Glutamyl-tRNA amidotransferase n=1 Tax=Berkelbacteria bacterium GW2011_GWA2_46_7 TaxID=1618335 RepID=A0A0G1QEV3_9BACT|nr:MAG: hypothetical protein UX60_C0023G0003 [Berkelbacteria bacterium GW2011_GWA2_46_7]OFW70212.1 MAG: glutamyl-tRNA amidotransferase [Alphaproteobacteria bacterium GWB1_45_5]OFW76502.1 MAG: glutamyl-tRNA amidotransferase [Alphaproteobacteria bacterium GWA1_45_9]OFW89610.1 MAG: glutamyl-tRNA amidotransferase [Alphaproteobacteria bacterium RIFCSPHIGHO2_01_FULL_41_14]HCI48396.1 glutamyl-tRNA amidotransferase [Holosporales bacterium]